MGLTEAIAGIADALSGLTGVDAVLTEPPNNLAAARTILVYERPGSSKADTNSSFLNTDVVMTDFHRVIAKDAASGIVTDTRALLDATRARLWDRFKNGRFGGSVIGLTGVETTYFGPAEYGESVTFSFSLSLAVTHGARIGS